MKIKLKKILFRAAVTLAFCIGLLITFVFNPSLLYGKATMHKNFVIYHNNELNEELTELIAVSFSKLQGHELFDEEIEISICLNDGSLYPALIQELMGPDVIRSFANKTVIHADILDVENDKMILSSWGNETFKASQWFTHSFTHCLQYKKYGFFGSNPIAGYDEWKWEGYSEYTSFGTHYDLNTLLKKYFEQTDGNWVEMEDGSKTLKRHLQYLTMVKYCIEIRQMTYDDILRSTDSPEQVFSEVIQMSDGKH
jgi:hypothetical protein